MEFTFSEKTQKKYSVSDAIKFAKLIISDRTGVKNPSALKLPKDLIESTEISLSLMQLNKLQDQILDLNLTPFQKRSKVKVLMV